MGILPLFEDADTQGEASWSGKEGIVAFVFVQPQSGVLSSKRRFEEDLSAGAVISQMAESEPGCGTARWEGGVWLQFADAEGNMRGEPLQGRGGRITVHPIDAGRFDIWEIDEVFRCGIVCQEGAQPIEDGLMKRLQRGGQLHLPGGDRLAGGDGARMDPGED